MTEKLLSFNEVAEYLNVKPSWLKQNWRSSGIPFVRFGRLLRCKPSDLETWIMKQVA